jgi:hypothetical protein
MPLYYNTPPAAYPLDLDEVKRFLRIGSVTMYDQVLNLLIQAMYDQGEIDNVLQYHYKRQLIKATLVLTLPKFSYTIECPRPPLVSVSSVEYRAETTGTWTEIDSSKYEVTTETGPNPGLITFDSDYDVPNFYEDEPYPVRVTYVAGYTNDDGDSTYEQIPAAIRLYAMNVLADYWHERKSTVFTNLDKIALNESMARLSAGNKAGRRFG